MASITFCAVHFTPVACFERAYSLGHLRAMRLLQLVTGALVSRFAETNARSATARSASSSGPNANGFRRSFRRSARVPRRRRAALPANPARLLRREKVGRASCREREAGRF